MYSNKRERDNPLWHEYCELRDIIYSLIEYTDSSIKHDPICLSLRTRFRKLDDLFFGMMEN